MKKLYFLFFFTIGLLANAQIVNIPDANFKAKLLESNTTNYIALDLVGNSFQIDSNSNGEIEVNEASQVGSLILNNSFISSLTGIEYFSNLTELYCEVNLLTSLDFSMLTNLQILHCTQNPLTSLNVNGLTNLEALYCGNGQLTILDVSGLINLRELDCSQNSLSSLVLNSLPNLEILSCNDNQINSLDISDLLSIKELYCFENQITSLDATGLINLERLWCYTNQLTSLNLIGLSNLVHLACSQNQLYELNFNGLINLRTLSCNNNQIALLDLNSLENLELVECNYNNLSSLDVNGLTNLNYLKCNNNQLTSLFIKNGSLESTLEFFNNPTLNYICVDDFQINTVQSMIAFGFPNCHINSYCTFMPGGVYYTITGYQRWDSNYNGCDAFDIPFPHMQINKINAGNLVGTYYTNVSGQYNINTQAGMDTYIPNLENPSYFNIFPTSFTVDFPTQTSPFNQDFCVTANGVKSDVEIVLLPITPARPGFDADYKLVYRNKGNQIENGSVSLTFDDTRLDYVAANPIYNTTAINSFTWNYTNLQPFETREIILTFNVNSPMETPAVNNGDILNYTATITTANTDETPIDNTFILDQIVVGSYDPNDKTCLEGTTIAPTEVGNYVHYVIRFENTGTFPAENIVVKDMIDLDKFDLATLIPLKGSHDFYTRINGNKVEFIFENINLDFNDATNDGYVVFKIKTLPSLVLGDTFTNNANIYFDYNFPITTNTYTTTVATLSTQDFDFGTYFTLYPNPAKDVLNIQTKQDLEVNSIEIYNQLGQIVMATTNVINSVDVANLASGTYFVKVNTEKGSANAKFVKE